LEESSGSLSWSLVEWLSGKLVDVEPGWARGVGILENWGMRLSHTELVPGLEGQEYWQGGFPAGPKGWGSWQSVAPCSMRSWGPAEP
jgi:hypothetical protein